MYSITPMTMTRNDDLYCCVKYMENDTKIAQMLNILL